MTDKSKDMCRDCRDDYYNKPGNFEKGECWMFADAKVVTRFRLHWWTAPTVPGAFTEVVTLSCHYEPGRFAFQEKLPSFAVNPHLLAGPQ